MRDKLIFTLCVIGLFGIAFLDVQCASANQGVGRAVLDSAEQLGELREQNRQLTERIDREQELYQQLTDALGRAEADAQSAGNDVRGAIQLLNEYKRAVDQYVAGIAKIQNTTANSK